MSRLRSVQPVQQSPPQSEVRAFAMAAQPKESSRVNVVAAYQPNEHEEVEQLWKTAELDSEKRIEKASLQNKFSAKFPSNRVSCITFISDQHIAPGTPVDFKRMREDAQLVAKTDDLYAILGGDAVDNHIKHHSAILAARSQPHDQYKLFDFYLQILQHRLLVVTSGNHDLWSNQYAGIDMVGWLSKEKRLAYAPYEARIAIQCGKVEYKAAVRHQYRLNSSFNQTHAVKQWLRLGPEEFDIGCIAHHHEAAMEQFIYRDKVCWGCRPGAYQITSAYSSVYGWNNAMPTCPSFLLFPDERQIIGIHDVRAVPKLLRAYNG